MENKYYEITNIDKPHPLLKDFINNINLKGNAIDLGCGSGRDSIFLVKNGWNVIAIDKEDTLKYIKKYINKKEESKIKFINKSFTEVELVESDLIISFFALSFCKPEDFQNLWMKIKNSLRPNGFFIGNFFGIEDGWKDNNNMTFFYKSDINKMFEKFEIKKINEIKTKKVTALGKLKKWHIIEIVAKKLN